MCGKKKTHPVMNNIQKVLEAFKGKVCFAWLDLVSVSDFTSFVLEFINPYEAICFFWVKGKTNHRFRSLGKLLRFQYAP